MPVRGPCNKFSSDWVPHRDKAYKDGLWLVKSCSAGRSEGIVLLSGRPEDSETLHKVGDP